MLNSLSGFGIQNDSIPEDRPSWEKRVEHSEIRIVVFGNQRFDGTICNATIACVRSFVEHHIEEFPNDYDEPLSPEDDPFMMHKCGPPPSLAIEIQSLAGITGEDRIYWRDLQAVVAGLYDIMLRPERNYLFDVNIYSMDSGRQIGSGWMRTKNSILAQSPEMASPVSVA